jgi:hypothetical protein
MFAATLLFSCGGGNPERKPTAQAEASKSLSVSLSLAQAVQCSDVATIAAGANHTVGLKEDGTVVAVGYNNYGQLNVSVWTKIRAIAAGAYHTVGLKEDGTVVAVGYNGYGQLNVTPWTKIKAIAAGAYHTVGLKEDGTVVAVGYNDYDQLNVTSWTNIKAIAAGMYHTVGLKEDGTVVAVGYNGFGQLDVSTSFTKIMPICGVAQDAAPPITTAMMTGTLGNNGWYVSDVQMTLTATDNDGGSGVKEIHYSVDGVETVELGSSASHSIAGDGTHAVTWYAIDNAGNMETPPQEMSINIDITSPSIPALAANSAILWPPNHKMVNVVIGGSIADGESGIASAIITVTDEYGIYNMTVPGFGSVFQLESWRADSDMDGRLYTITAVITDNAGNQSTATTTVLVPHNTCSGPLSEDRLHGRNHRDRSHHQNQDHQDQKNRHDQDHHDHAHR